MKELAALLVAFASVISYFLLATRFGVYQRWPVVHYLGCLLACALLVWLVTTQTGGRRLLAAGALTVAVALTTFFAWYTVSYSGYAANTSAHANGEPLGELLTGLTLASHSGEATPVFRRGEDRGTLLVFYRGFW